MAPNAKPGLLTITDKGLEVNRQKSNDAICVYLVKLNAENTRYVKIVKKSFQNLDRASTKPNFMN
jgi:hypothetical protein